MRPIDADALKDKLQQHHDFWVMAWGGFSKMPISDKKRVDEITNCIAEVVNVPTIDALSEWIPCEDRLPSKSGTYLVTYEWVGQSGTKYTEIEVIDFERGRWSDHTRHYEKVTAWMPLPKPYEEVKENE